MDYNYARGFIFNYSSFNDCVSCSSFKRASKCIW